MRTEEELLHLKDLLIKKLVILQENKEGILTDRERLFRIQYVKGQLMGLDYVLEISYEDKINKLQEEFNRGRYQ